MQCCPRIALLMTWYASKKAIYVNKHILRWNCIVYERIEKVPLSNVYKQRNMVYHRKKSTLERCAIAIWCRYVGETTLFVLILPWSGVIALCHFALLSVYRLNFCINLNKLCFYKSLMSPILKNCHQFVFHSQSCSFGNCKLKHIFQSILTICYASAYEQNWAPPSLASAALVDLVREINWTIFTMHVQVWSGAYVFKIKVCY